MHFEGSQSEGVIDLKVERPGKANLADTLSEKQFLANVLL